MYTKVDANFSVWLLNLSRRKFSDVHNLIFASEIFDMSDLGFL